MKRIKKSKRRSAKLRRSRSVKPRRSRTKRRSVKPRRSRKKHVDTGDFSDTGRYNINEKVIKDLENIKLLKKYNELIRYLKLRKAQLELSDKSTFKVDIQIKSAEKEKSYLIKNFTTYSRGLILLNSMP